MATKTERNANEVLVSHQFVPKTWTEGRYSYEHIKLTTEILQREANENLRQAQSLKASVENLVLLVKRLKAIKFVSSEVDLTFSESFNKIFQMLSGGKPVKKDEDQSLYNYPRQHYQWMSELQDMVGMDSSG